MLHRIYIQFIRYYTINLHVILYHHLMLLLTFSMVRTGLHGEGRNPSLQINRRFYDLNLLICLRDYYWEGSRVCKPIFEFTGVILDEF